MLAAEKKLETLVSFIKKKKTEKFIVFFLSCACVDYFTRVLKLLLNDIECVGLHGQMDPKKREGN
jgi:ATP-dependent RNA helicase DDX55/SPB4